MNSLMLTKRDVDETVVERNLRLATEARGGAAKKLVPTGDKDWPDRILVLPRSRIVFVELKKRGKKARASQRRKHQWLTRRGHLVLVVDRVEDIPAVFEAVELLW